MFVFFCRHRPKLPEELAEAAEGELGHVVPSKPSAVILPDVYAFTQSAKVVICQATLFYVEPFLLESGDQVFYVRLLMLYTRTALLSAALSLCWRRQYTQERAVLSSLPRVVGGSSHRNLTYSCTSIP